MNHPLILNPLHQRNKSVTAKFPKRYVLSSCFHNPDIYSLLFTIPFFPFQISPPQSDDETSAQIQQLQIQLQQLIKQQGKKKINKKKKAKSSSENSSSSEDTSQDEIKPKKSTSKNQVTIFFLFNLFHFFCSAISHPFLFRLMT